MSFEWLSVFMFVVFFFFLMSGYPVAFGFAGSALVVGLLGYALGAFDPHRLLLLPNRWFGTMSDQTLLAIPFFIFLGAILEKSGMAEELLTTVGVLMGPLRGGIAIAVILVGTLLAATTGVVAATIIAMGLISLPTMLGYGYEKKIATGTIMAAGTLAQVIPPSLVLIVLSSQIGVSVGDLYLGAVIPGLMLAGSYILYVLFVAITRPQDVPALPKAARTMARGALVRRVLSAFIPPVVLIFAVLGSIFLGLATASEAGAVGAVGAVILTILKGRFNWKLMFAAADATTRTTTLVLMIIFCSSIFAVVFDGVGGSQFFTNLLLRVPGGFWGFIVVSNIVVFILGMFLEFIEIVFIVMPLFVPAAKLLGVDMVWFGVMMGVNLQLGFLTPPVGFSLFYMQSVVPKEVQTSDIHRSAVPFIALQLVVLILMAAFPQTVRWLVDISFKPY